MSAELSPAGKKTWKEKPKIWFSDEDPKGVQLPHNDPLLLTLRVKNFLVKRILVDPGSSSEVLYFDCFKKLGLKEEDLREARTLLIRFSSKPVYSKGKVTLTVQVEGASVQANFLVVDAPSPYNAIMGQT